MLVFTSLLTAAVLSQCTKMTTRYEVHSMTDDDIKTYRETIRKALTTPDPQNPRLSIWEAAANFHFSCSEKIHNTPAFYFWHRLFISTVEKKLQAINPDFYFPYWDSSREWNSYQNSKAIQITDMSDTSLVLNRTLSNTDLPAAETYAHHFQESIATGTGFGYYHGAVEVVHGNLHIAVGGEMATMNSPRDPLFYMHHGNVDYEWSKCQVAWANRYPQVAGEMPDHIEAILTTQIPYYNNVFADVLDMSNLCVTYAPYGTRPPPRGRNNTTIPPTRTTSTTTTTNAAGTTITTTLSGGNSTNTIAGPVLGTSTTTTTTVGTTTTRVAAPGTPTVPQAPVTTANTSNNAIPTNPAIVNPLPPPPPKVNGCPPPLPESWIVMNNLNRTEIALAAAACQKVVAAVAQGVTFTPPPVYKPEMYKETVAAVLPKDYTVAPPSPPQYNAVSSGSARVEAYFGLFAVVLSLFC